MHGEFLFFMATGLFAQVVDGALGMAFGTISATVLLGAGIPPATASASIHTAEIVTTAVSGLSHLWFKNVDRRLFTWLVVPGIVGGIAGANLLTHLPGQAVRPFVAAYLVLAGMLIMWRAFRPSHTVMRPATLVPLGLVGGLFDSFGGGWGEIVTSTLVAKGTTPRYAIGSVAASEFFVASATATTFAASIGIAYWPIALALVLGGVCAAPLAAYIATRIRARTLMVLVATVIVALSTRTLVLALT
jgi:uncharacterized protein